MANTRNVAHKEVVDTDFKKVMKGAANAKIATSVFKALLFFVNKMMYFGCKLEELKISMGWASTILSVMLIPFYFLNLTQAAIFDKADKPTRALQVASAIIGIGMGVLGILITMKALFIATPFLIIAGAARTVVENAIQIGINTYQQFFGTGVKEERNISKLKKNLLENENISELSTESKQITELTDLINKKPNRMNQSLKKMHGIVQGCFAMVGGILLLSPPTMIIGASILLGLGIYGALDHFGYNPIHLAGKGINALAKKISGKPLFSDPFETKTKLDVLNELRQKKGLCPLTEKTNNKGIKAAGKSSTATITTSMDGNKDKNLTNKNAAQKEEVIKQKTMAPQHQQKNSTGFWDQKDHQKTSAGTTIPRIFAHIP